MPLALYNTLTQKKEPFVTAEPGRARVYICGPTVYDYAHLGHARCYTVFDVFVRHARASGLELRYVRNVTDVDDKILNRAKENGETAASLSERFTKAFHEDMALLGNLAPDVEPRVSGHLEEIRALITRLIEKKAAYVSGNDVYFSVADFPDYGKLSHRRIDDMEAGASGRVSADEEKKKRHPADFALWKSAPEGEEGWTSPWGWGRPGWHIECSAMSIKHLGESFDLHGGGLDLIFPHHENEIAQSEAATGQPFAKHWMHNGFVEVNKEKMGKSLGNFFTAREIFRRAEPEAVRYFVMTVHYRSPLNFEWDTDEQGNVWGFPQITEAEKRVEYLYSTMERFASIPEARIVDKGKVPDAIAGFEKALESALDDDLNMPLALAATAELLKSVNELVDLSTRKKGEVPRAALETTKRAFQALRARLGLGAEEASAFLGRIRARRVRERGLTETLIEEKIAAREAARVAKDFALADALRAELTGLGVELMDASGKTNWRMQ